MEYPKAINMAFAIQTILLFALMQGAFCGNTQGSVDGNSFDVAVIMPSTGGWTVGQSIGSAPISALQRITTESLLPFPVNWEWKDTQCDAREGTKVFMELWTAASDLDAIIGGGCSEVCKTVALLAAYFNLPYVSFGCNDDGLSDTTTYPTFTRTVGPWGSLSTMMDKMFEYFQWTTRVGIAAGYESIMMNTATTFKEAFEAPSTIGHTEKMVFYGTLDSAGLMTHRQLAIYFKSRTRVIIVLMYSTDLRAFLLACRDEGMMNGDYAYITIDADLNVPQSETIRPEDVSTSYNGILDLHITKPTGTDWDTFATSVVSDFGNAKFSGATTIGTSANIDQVDVHAGMLHDAFLTWAYAVKDAYAANTANIDDGVAITSQILGGLTFTGISGEVEFDSNGNRKPDYTVSIVQDLAHTDIFHYSERTTTLSKVYRPASGTDFSGLSWKGGLSGPPSSEPKCGWNNEHCPDKKIALKVTLSLLFIFAVLAGVGYLGYKRWEYLKDLNDLSLWKITVMDMSDSRIHTQLMASRTLLRAKTKTSLTEGHEPLRNVATVGGKLCVVKPLNKPSVNVKDTQLLVEMKNMRELKHPNINPFVAAICDHPHVSLCMLYADRGSLQDIFYNPEVNLTWDFKMSISIDIAKGLSYLHSSRFGSHGNLTSGNCVVDRRWVCKITDYGAAHFKKGSRTPDQQANQNKLWRAPELLADPHAAAALSYGTREGDVYSYGILLLEIITREVPYRQELEELTLTEIIKRVSERHLPAFRPYVDPNIAESNTDWIELMVLCWEDDPIIRPTAKNIIQSLSDMSGKRSFDTSEKMLTLMEDHSHRLEELLSARNDELNVEKKRVNNLLHSFLPQSIAFELMQGNAVKAKVYNDVCVCYVKILNLDSILRRVPAHELTDVLHKLFEQFDSVSSESDVFKMETATSGVLFVNGCPEPKLAIEEETVQLAARILMNAVDTESDWSKELLLGVHSGPVVAGIAGLLVPRFCIFGAMLNVAIRLAESSEPMFIHVSESVAKQISSENYTIKGGPGVKIGDDLTKTFLVADI